MQEPVSSAPKFSEAGVKRITLAAVFPGATESYELVEDLSKKLNLTVGPKKMLCADLKIINIALGLQGHQSRHCCPLCEWAKGANKGSNQLRTLESLSQNFQAFQRESGLKKDVKYIFSH